MQTNPSPVDRNISDKNKPKILTKWYPANTENACPVLSCHVCKSKKETPPNAKQRWYPCLSLEAEQTVMAVRGLPDPVVEVKQTALHLSSPTILPSIPQGFVSVKATFP